MTSSTPSSFAAAPAPGGKAEISFVTTQSDARAAVYVIDSKERTVATLHPSGELQAGPHEFAWDGRTDAGTKAPPGTYGVRVVLGAADRDIVPPGSVTIEPGGTETAVTGYPGPGERADGLPAALDRDRQRAARSPRVGSRRRWGSGLASACSPGRSCWRRSSSSPTTGRTTGSCDLRDSPAVIAAGAVAALVVLAVLLWLIRARPRWLPIALIAALPFRIPLDLGGSTANLLVPLYGLLAAGLIAALLEPERILPDADRTAPGDLRRWLAPVLAVILVLYGLQTGLHRRSVHRGQERRLLLRPVRGPVS